MTTVSWDGKLLVADTQATASGMKAINPSEKIHLLTDGVRWHINKEVVRAFGVSGDAMAPAIVKQLLSSDAGLTHGAHILSGTGSFTVLLITDKLACYRFAYRPKDPNGPSTQLLQIHGKDSIGSGSGFADAVMSLGLDAVMAVRGASNVDIHTGGDLRVWDSIKPNHLEVIKNY